MQTLVKCCECAATVRRDDGPLAKPGEKPRSLAFFNGAGAELTLQFCNPCYEDALEGSRERLERNKQP